MARRRAFRFHFLQGPSPLTPLGSPSLMERSPSPSPLPRPRPIRPLPQPLPRGPPHVVAPPPWREAETPPYEMLLPRPKSQPARRRIPEPNSSKIMQSIETKAKALFGDIQQVAAQTNSELHDERQRRKNAEMKVAELQKRVICVMCLLNERRVMFQPCFHVVSCNSCQYKVEECPVCRTPIDGRLKIGLA